MPLALKHLLSPASLFAILTAGFAVMLQLQITLFESETYLGLRVNVADFFLPAMAIVILGSVALKKTQWPVWHQPFGYWALFLLSGAFILALLNGYRLSGEFSTWAMLNKTLGWFTLCAYMGIGAWTVRNASGNLYRIFTNMFLVAFCIGVLFCALHHFLYWEMSMTALSRPSYYLSGFTGNRNAFSFLLITAFSLITFSTQTKKPLTRFEKILHLAFWCLLPFAIFFNASRALWICLVPLIGVVLYAYRALPFKIVTACVLVGLAISVFVFPNTSERALVPLKFTTLAMKSDQDAQQYAETTNLNPDYDNRRFLILRHSFELIAQYPLTGAGLGSIIRSQEAEGRDDVAVLDNTALWIFTEMGPLGAFVFIWVYFLMLAALYRCKDNQSEQAQFCRAAMCMLLLFGLFSIFHEILYTRFMWFILGMALVVPKTPIRANT